MRPSIALIKASTPTRTNRVTWSVASPRCWLLPPSNFQQPADIRARLGWPGSQDSPSLTFQWDFEPVVSRIFPLVPGSVCQRVGKWQEQTDAGNG